ncbi:MAG TPA: hypothetical protein VI485_06030 [Vicinamibacterales bacterium]|nr:hypothetical protein [Vicinamibacterales bacterium]
MRRRPSLAVLCFTGLLAVAYDVDAQTTGRAATAAKPAAPSWLGSPIREEPSPTIVSIRGVGTANAMAEARLSPQELASFCKENAHLYQGAAACVKQKQSEYGTRIFRASADCTAGKITTSGDMAYTLDGLWDSSDIGAGRTRWRDAEGKVVGRDLANNGLHISQQWETLCPAPVTPALIARARGGPAPQAGQRAPSVCPPGRACAEVNSFAAAITDFRSSQYDQNTKAVSATVRFVNKTNRPLILGYVRAATVAINEAGNRYTVEQPANVRGIAEIAGGQFDPKFTVQPGQAADARFELWWRWNGRDIIGQRAWDLDLTIREVSEVAPGQYRFGQEHALQFKAVSVGNMTSAAPAGGALATVSGGTAPTAAPAPAAPAPQVAVNEPDACVGKTRCFDAGPFVAEILTATATRENYARPWHTVSMNIRFRNKTSEPIILGYVVPSGVLIDDLGNRYGPAGAPNDAKGIGRVQANKADPQFVLRPGESRQATLGQARVMRGTQTATVIGSSYTFDVAIAQLEVIYNGQQVRTIREHTLTFPNFALTSGAGAAAAAGNPAAPGTAGTPPATIDDVKKAGEALRGLFGKGKK